MMAITYTAYSLDSIDQMRKMKFVDQEVVQKFIATIDAQRTRVKELEGQRDRLMGILDTMAGFGVGSIHVAHAMRDMAKVGVVEIIKAEGIELIEKLREDRRTRPDVAKPPATGGGK